MNKPPETYDELMAILEQLLPTPKVETIVDNDSGRVLTKYTFLTPDDSHKVEFRFPQEMLEQWEPDFKAKMENVTGKA